MELFTCLDPCALFTNRFTLHCFLLLYGVAVNLLSTCQGRSVRGVCKVSFRAEISSTISSPLGKIGKKIISFDLVV